LDDDDLRETATDDYQARENLWDEAWPSRGEEQAHGPDEPDNLDEELPFPEVVGTTDSLESVRDAEPYTPPIDPPVLPGGQEAIHVATGFGLSTDEEDYAEPLPRGDEDIRDEVMRLLQDDSATSKLPLEVEVDQGVVRLYGAVPSIDDAEAATVLIGNLRGVVDVIDETTIVPSAVD
jgi:hypothetical protein